ncbi:MAG: CorA family divalent cation transporter [Xanthobacteraceae bacterium]
MHPEPSAATAREHAVWVDLADPTPAEITRVEALTGAKVRAPDRLDRFYVADQVETAAGQTTLRALLLGGLDQHRPRLFPVTFARAGGPLVTVTRGNPEGLAWLARECPSCTPADADDMFAAMLDMVVDHTTSILDKVSGDLDEIDRRLFQHRATPKRRLALLSSTRARTHHLETILTELGYQREVLVKLRRSVLSFRRLVNIVRERGRDEALTTKLRDFEHELSAVAEAQSDLASTASFMLDGAVGYITILQSKTINIMTVLGILLTPPMLIASIYGMNFKIMPELQWDWGYAWALGLMVVSVVLTFLIVRLRGWL